jgi:hypothetical protein
MKSRSRIVLGRMTVGFVFLLLVAGMKVAIVSGQESKKETPKDSIAAEIVGEGVISTADDEFGGGPSPDGATIYFDKTVPPHYLYILCESHLKDGKWSAPGILPFSGQYRDSDPVISPDGKTMFFASDRPVKGVDEHRFLIWQAKKTEKGWSEATLLPGAINSEGSQVFASIANSGTIYFTSSRKTGQYDIFRSRLVNGEYKEAEDLGQALNGPGIWTFEAWVAPDESYLLLGSFGRENGYGSADIFVSFQERGGWTKPANLGPTVNTNARDYSPRASADGEWLYFASERGMPYEKREQPLTYQQFEDSMKSIRNGLGNIYRVPLKPLLKAARGVPGS